MEAVTLPSLRTRVKYGQHQPPVVPKLQLQNLELQLEAPRLRSHRDSSRTRRTARGDQHTGLKRRRSTHRGGISTARHQLPQGPAGAPTGSFRRRVQGISGPRTARQPTSTTSTKGEAPTWSQIRQRGLPPPMLPSGTSSRQERSQTSDTPKQVMLPSEAIQYYDTDLTSFEKKEIFDFKEVYYVGTLQVKKVNGRYDDSRGDYRGDRGDHIGYRYEVISLLGKGSFGRVLKCRDHSNGKLVAVKLLRSKRRFRHQGFVELKILRHIKQHGGDRSSHLISLTDNFWFRGHLCIVSEILSLNLYEFMKANNFAALSLSLIKRFSIQICVALQFLLQHHIVHCDIKPENILLVQRNKSYCKVIDLGSGCFESERVYTYIQSRFYRAPEVILGLPYGPPIDMFSFGTVLAEFATGYPIFPGEDERDQLSCIMEVLGPPPRSIIQQCPRKEVFFDSNLSPISHTNSKGVRRRPGSRPLALAVRSTNVAFVDFLERCLDWNPETRMTPNEALQHPFLASELPALASGSSTPAP